MSWNSLPASWLFAILADHPPPHCALQDTQCLARLRLQWFFGSNIIEWTNILVYFWQNVQFIERKRERKTIGCGTDGNGGIAPGHDIFATNPRNNRLIFKYKAIQVALKWNNMKWELVLVCESEVDGCAAAYRLRGGVWLGLAVQICHFL